MYFVNCDNCGAEANHHDGIVAWREEWYAKSVANESGFIEHKGKDICPDCWTYDDNDNVVIKPKYP